MQTRSTEAGETLVETLITVVLLGLLATGIVGAFASVITVSNFDAETAGAEAVVRTYAQAWQRRAYVDCTAGSSANPYSGKPPGYSPPAGYTAAVSAVRFWDGTSSSPAAFVTTCAAGGDAGLQELVVSVTPTDAPATTLTIDKRAP